MNPTRLHGGRLAHEELINQKARPGVRGPGPGTQYSLAVFEMAPVPPFDGTWPGCACLYSGYLSRPSGWGTAHRLIVLGVVQAVQVHY